MAVVGARCEQCGNVEMTHEDITVFLDLSTKKSGYRFMCPSEEHPDKHPETKEAIGRLVVKNNTDPRVTEMLLATGAKIHRLKGPVETAPNGDFDSEQFWDLRIDFGLADGETLAIAADRELDMSGSTEA